MKKLLTPPILTSLALVTLIFAYFSFNAPYMADNFVFSRNISPGFADFYTGKEVTASPLTLESAFRQAYDMYFSWCGRFTGNLAVYLLFLLPPKLYSLLSCLNFALYILLLQMCVFGRDWREKLSAGWVLALAALVWLSIPSFGEAFLWLSVGGQIALISQLSMLLPYRFALQSSDAPCHTKARVLILAPLFLLAGIATSSLDFPTSAALPGTAMAAVAYVYFTRKTRTGKIPWILLCGAIGLLVGAALTLMAPGNAQRLLLTHDGNVLSWLALSWPERILQWLLHLPLLAALFPAPFIILVWGLCALWKARGRNFYRFIPVGAILFLLPFALSIGAFLFTAWPPPRAFASCAIQLLIFSLILAQKASTFAAASLTRKWRFLQLLLAICAISTIVWEGIVFFRLHQEVRIRENIIATSRGDELLLPPLNVPANTYQPLGGELGDISEDPAFWVNRAMALHYGFRTARKAAPAGKIQYLARADGLALDMNLYREKDRIFIRTSDSALAKLLEKGAYVYYYGRPALLSRLWNPIADKIYAYLAKLQKGDTLLLLIPLLMARTNLSLSVDSEGEYIWRSPIVRLDKAKTVWLIKPGDGNMSFNLIPFKNDTAPSQKEEKSPG